MRNETAVVKSKFVPEILANLKEGEVFPYVKILNLSERCFNINHEKSKIARSMESRMSQMRQKHLIKGKKYSNQSFTSLMNNGEVVCGTVLTCTEVTETPVESDADLTDMYAGQLAAMGANEALPIVKVVDPSASFVDIGVVKQVISMLSEKSISAARTLMKEKNTLITEEFCGTLSNGNLVVGTIIRKA